MNNVRNQVQLIGNVGKDVDVKSIANGSQVATFSIATNEYYKNVKGEKVQDTQWHNVVIWGKQAELAAKVLAKGTEVCVQGKLVHRSYETAEGGKRYVTEVKATSFLKLSKPEAEKVPF